MTRSDALAFSYLAVTAACVAVFGFSVTTIAAPAAVFLAILVDGACRPGSSVLVSKTSRAPSAGDRVALTFDDGPDIETTPAILDALAAHGARATFFAIGRALEASPAIAERIVREGHELANHSFAHSRLTNFFGATSMRHEIERGEEVIARFQTPPRRLYRPPMGLANPALARAAKRMNLRVISWSVHARDTRRTSTAKDIAHRVLSRVRAGDIVVLHDGSDDRTRRQHATRNAVPTILDGLAARGLACVTVSELLRKENARSAPR